MEQTDQATGLPLNEIPYEMSQSEESLVSSLVPSLSRRSSSASFSSSVTSGDVVVGHNTLFIGDLAKSVTEEELLELFNSIGDVSNAVIKRDRSTGSSLGYGFVHYVKTDDATMAKKKLNRHALGVPPREIRIGWAQKNTTLFIGDLSSSISTSELREIFRAYGPLYEEETFVKNRSYGFVKFVRREDAELAKKSLDGKIIGNKPIRIGWGDANTQKFCVHLQFDYQHGSSRINESVLWRTFQQFGKVVHVSMPPGRNKESKGYAFVHFEDNEAGERAAIEAIQSLTNSAVAGVSVQCNFGRKHSKRSPPLSQQAEALPRGAPLMPVYMLVPTPHGGWQPMPYLVPQQYYMNMPMNPYNPMLYEQMPADVPVYRNPITAGDAALPSNFN